MNTNQRECCEKCGVVDKENSHLGGFAYKCANLDCECHSPDKSEWEERYKALISTMLWDYQNGKDTLKSFISDVRTQAVEDYKAEVVATVKNELKNVYLWEAKLDGHPANNIDHAHNIGRKAALEFLLTKLKSNE